MISTFSNICFFGLFDIYCIAVHSTDVWTACTISGDCLTTTFALHTKILQMSKWISKCAQFLFTFHFFAVSFKNIVSSFELLRLLDCVKILTMIFALKTVNFDCKHRHHSWPSHGHWVINNRYWLHHLIQVHTLCSHRINYTHDLWILSSNCHIKHVNGS